MKECTTIFKNRKILYQLAGVLLILAIWHIISLFVSPLVVPSIGETARSLVQLLSQESFPGIYMLTVVRLVSGLAIGIAAGCILGLLSGLFWRVEAVFSSVMSILQSVPPVCWVVLALVWFGFNGKPSIFIVATSTIPTVSINIAHGVRNIDTKLLEMAKLYEFSPQMRIRHIILPSVRPYFVSAVEIVIGGGWKLAVMGEVLTTATGIGGSITAARLNIDPARIIAWSCILVISSFVTSKVLVFLLAGGRRRRRC